MEVIKDCTEKEIKLEENHYDQLSIASEEIRTEEDPCDQLSFANLEKEIIKTEEDPNHQLSAAASKQQEEIKIEEDMVSSLLLPLNNETR
jgi:hypothetical protein